MEKKMENLGLFIGIGRVYIGVILGEWKRKWKLLYYDRV